MNTKNITDKAERKKTETHGAQEGGAQRRNAPPAWPAARMKKKIRHQAQGQRKR